MTDGNSEVEYTVYLAWLATAGVWAIQQYTAPCFDPKTDPVPVPDTVPSPVDITQWNGANGEPALIGPNASPPLMTPGVPYPTVSDISSYGPPQLPNWITNPGPLPLFSPLFDAGLGALAGGGAYDIFWASLDFAAPEVAIPGQLAVTFASAILGRACR